MSIPSTRSHSRRLRLESLERRSLLAVDGLSMLLPPASDPPDVVDYETALVLQVAGEESSPAASLSTGSIVIGENAPDQNFHPFSSSAVTRYQQVYSADEFPGSVMINGLKFFHDPFDVNFPGTFSNGTLNFELSVTAKEVDGLDTVDLGNNVTSSVLGTGTLVLNGEDGRDLIIGITPFDYDPALGNLLVDMRSPTGLSRDFGLPVPFEAYNGEDGTSAGGIFSRAYDGGGGGFEGWGLKTEFLLGNTPLESPMVQVIVDGGNLTLIGNDDSNEVLITQGTNGNEFILSSAVTDFGDGAGVPVTVSGITGDITVQFGDNADVLQVGGTDLFLTLPGNLFVDGGGGADQLRIGPDATNLAAKLTVLGDVEIKGGAGDNRIKLGGDPQEDYGSVLVEVFGDVSVTNGDGNNDTRIGGIGHEGDEYDGESITQVHIAGDVLIRNGDGLNQTIIGSVRENVHEDYYYNTARIFIDGDVKVVGGDGGNNTTIGGYTGYYGHHRIEIAGDVKVRGGSGADVTTIGGSGSYYGESDLIIGGDVEIVNRAGEDRVTLGGKVDGRSLVEIAGDVMVRNGDDDDSTTIGGYGAYGLDGSTLLVHGDVEVRNGSGNDSTVVGQDGGYYGSSHVDIKGDLTVRNGEGSDITRVGGDGGYDGSSVVDIAGDVDIHNGKGDDETRIGGDGSYYYGHAIVNIAGDLSVGNGQGNDITRIGGDGGSSEYYDGGSSSVTIAGDVEIGNGDGDDQTRIGGDGGKSPYGGGDSTILIGGDLTVKGGRGNDRTDVGGRSRDGASILQIVGNALINGGDGNDKTIIRALNDALIQFAHDLTIKGGAGKDLVRIEGISVEGKTKIKTGSEEDIIRIKDAYFAGLVKLDGGGDAGDLFDDEGGNVFADGLILEGF